MACEVFGGLTALAGCLEPSRWPSPLLGATGSKPFEALDGGSQRVPLGFQIENDALEVHFTPPSVNERYIRDATATVAASGSPAGSTRRRSSATTCLPSAILGVLHPAVTASSYAQFRAGHLRDAVFNAFVAVFDLLREKSGLDKDGAGLVAEALSLEKPKLILSTLATESGQNDQKGFIQILQGAYLGVRNPKAHSLASDLDDSEAAQYLVFASLLARRVEEARPPS